MKDLLERYCAFCGFPKNCPEALKRCKPHKFKVAYIPEAVFLKMSTQDVEKAFETVI